MTLVWQQVLPGMEIHLADERRKAVGVAGEQWAAAALERAGYYVSFTCQRAPGDLRVLCPDTGEIIRIEVKTARRTRRKVWQFNLYRKLHDRVCTDAQKSDFVVLLAVHPSGRITPFVLPAAILGQQKQVTIAHPDGLNKWARYRQPGRVLYLTTDNLEG